MHTNSTGSQQQTSPAPGLVDISPAAISKREREAASFLYRNHAERGRQRWSDGKIEAAKWVNPYRARSVWTHEDVDLVFDIAAEKVIRQHGQGQLKRGLTSTYVKTVIRNTAISYYRRHNDERGDETSLSSPVKPKPGSDAGGAAATLEDQVAGPRHTQPEQLLLRGFLVSALQDCIAELPKKQLGAVRLRELIGHDVDRVEPSLIGPILDLTSDISFSAHTSAYGEAKRTIKRKLVEKLGHEQLAHLLSEVDVFLDLDGIA